MFKTVKSKILITAVVMLAVLMLAFGCYAVISRMWTKQLMVQNYKYSISFFVEDINDSVLKAEDNLKSLALIGSLFYKTDRSYELTDRVIKRIFENYPESLGGGIWFIPYKLDKNQKYVCFYAYRDKDNKIVIDRNFSSEEYDYPNQGWYKQIISRVTPEHNIVWTKPYFENLGSYSKMVTVGTGIFVDGELVGVATVDWEINSVINKVAKKKPHERTFSMYKQGGEIKSSFALLGNEEQDYIITTSDPYLDNEKLVGHSLKEIPWYTSAKKLYETTYINYQGKKYIPFVNTLRNGMSIIICIPKYAMFSFLDKWYGLMILAILILAFIIPALLYLSMNKYIINPIDKLINIARKIGKGEDIEIKLEKPEEFAQLASTFDKMTNDIKMITNEKAKINSELLIAKSIQASSLPNVFPPFPNQKEFDIFASMEAAKEVGGDFYDFFFIDENRFMFLIADVSGKGVPAALFMMTVKTLINNISQMNYNPNELIETINKKICEINKQGFFVTVLAGITDIKTGQTSIINCGHNPPLIKRQNGQYEYIKLEPNIPLGIFDNVKFEIYETTMYPGDLIYTYTDGVTEATNEKEEIYGSERLLECINKIQDDNPVVIANDMKAAIKEYIGSVAPSDDITMLIFKYNGISEDTKIFKQIASTENYKQFYTWLHNVCKDWALDSNLINKLDMCAEEIFANISFYAYPQSQGTIETKMTKGNNEIIFEFTDEGTEYNPLEKPDPDISLPPEERPLGGLGIYMVKEMTDDVSYKRENNKNILTLIFNL